MIGRTYVRLHATAKTVNDVPERLLTMYPVCTACRAVGLAEAGSGTTVKLSQGG
jgi:hypothetical protein